MSTYDIWTNGVLNGMGAPTDATNLDTLWAWSGAESGADRMRWNNPLNTTQPEGAGNVDANSVGVKIYPTVEQGIVATVTTLLNGYYPTIVSHFRHSVPRAQWDDACHELGTWGTGCGWLNVDYGLAPQELTPELTAEQDGLLRQIFNLLMVGYYTSPAAPGNEGFALTTLKPELDAIKAAVAGIAPGSDGAAITALGAKVDALAADILRIETALKAA